MDAEPKPAPPVDDWWGTTAIRTFLTMGVFGMPLLIAFGLGVVLWAWGYLCLGVCGLIGLVRDRAKGRATIAVTLWLVLFAGILANRQHWR